MPGQRRCRLLYRSPAFTAMEAVKNHLGSRSANRCIASAAVSISLRKFTLPVAFGAQRE
jgi:hypothetical protein